MDSAEIPAECCVCCIILVIFGGLLWNKPSDDSLHNWGGGRVPWTFRPLRHGVWHISVICLCCRQDMSRDWAKRWETNTPVFDLVFIFCQVLCSKIIALSLALSVSWFPDDICKPEEKKEQVREILSWWGGNGVVSVVCVVGSADYFCTCHSLVAKTVNPSLKLCTVCTQTTFPLTVTITATNRCQGFLAPCSLSSFEVAPLS